MSSFKAWTIQVRKNDYEGEPYLRVFLRCVESENENFAYPVHALYQLLSFNETIKEPVYSVGPYVMDKHGGYGLLTLIQWMDLLDAKNMYVKNDTIQLKIDIEPADPEDENKSIAWLENISQSCDDGCTSTKRLKISHIDNLMAMRSEDFQIRKVPLFFAVYKDPTGHLGIGLHRRLDNGTSFGASLKMNLISSKPHGDFTEQIQATSIQSGDQFFTDEFISWNELMKPENGFVQNISIVIEFEIGQASAEAQQALLECSICLGNLQQKRVSSTPCVALHTTYTGSTDEVSDVQGRRGTEFIATDLFANVS